MLEGKPCFLSVLRMLNPVLDAKEVLRVGDPSERSDLNVAQKHQYMMPAKSILHKITVIYYHKKQFYIGPQHYYFICGKNSDHYSESI